MCTPLAMNVTERSINSDKMMSFKHPEEISIRVTRPNSYKSACLRLGNDRPPTHIASFTLQIQDRNMPFSSPSMCRPAITMYSSTILHTRDKLYQGQLNYKPVCLWSVDGNQSFRRKPTQSEGECRQHPQYSSKSGLWQCKAAILRLHHSATPFCHR